ncbi:hypothetical protein [Porphyrobacter sp. AAP60]|uniref:hypothetical protein n=1 Tax=Porphyrobacter sp. AAP60 TaxID=1523423 RepID=UPI0006B9D0C4|nr:hypothetical protein [Porphyrobacter sp. AAP60]
MALKIRALAVAGALAGTTMFAAPASAAVLPATGLGTPSAVFDSSRYNPASATADWGCRWNCGWGHRRGWRRNRVGAGDVLIGAAIIGGIAAIASSNNRRQRDRDVVIVERDVRDREWRDDNRRYDDRRTTTPRSTGAAGLDNAVNQCLTRIERDVRVDTVDNVDRTGAGWVVSGLLFNGSPFQCRIGNSGQIDGIDYGGGFSGIGYSGGAESPAPRGEGQWDDRRYATARMAVGGSVRPDLAVQEAQMSSAPMQVAQGQARPVVTDRMPAYPGGPIPGEEIPETIDGDL